MSVRGDLAVEGKRDYPASHCPSTYPLLSQLLLVLWRVKPIASLTMGIRLRVLVIQRVHVVLEKGAVAG